MFFHGLPASAMYYRDQRVSSLYWRSMKIWQADADSGPLRKGQLNIAGGEAAFSLVVTPFDAGALEIHGSDFTTQLKVLLAKGALAIQGNAGGFTLAGAAILDSGNLTLVRKTAAFRENVTLSTGNLRFTRSTASFRFTSNLARGNLYLHPKIALLEFSSTLAKRVLNIHGNTGAFGLIGVSGFSNGFSNGFGS